MDPSQDLVQHQLSHLLKERIALQNSTFRRILEIQRLDQVIERKRKKFSFVLNPDLNLFDFKVSYRG